MTTPTIEGQRPSSEQEQIIQTQAEYWRGISNEAPVQSIARIEEAAKQLVSINSALQGVYFTIYAFSDLREQILELYGLSSGRFLLFIFFIPVLLWIISLYYATRVFVPQAHTNINLNDVSIDAWMHVQQAYTNIRDKKLKSLHNAHFWLIGSFIVLLVLLALLALLPSVPTSGPTEIILLTPTPSGTGP